LKQILIIGGGTAGISAALNLAERGIFTTIVEKSHRIGGHAHVLCCKGLVECVRCDVCLSTDKLSEVAQSDHIRVFTGTRVRRVSGRPGDYRVSLERGPQYVREKGCVACGECRQVCPTGAIGPNGAQGIPLTYRIDEARCLRWKGEECTRCVATCPTEAIDFGARVSRKQLNVGAIIVANGFEPFNAELEPRYGHGRVRDVLTSLEAEERIGLEGHLLTTDDRMPTRVAIIQCVGSRDDRVGASYCSKVCCKYALKLAEYLTLVNPDIKISFFFMDWRPLDMVDQDLYSWAERNGNARIIRSRPAEVMVSEEGKPLVRFAPVDDSRVVEEEYDMVILSIGIAPPADVEDVATMLGIEREEGGFLLTADSPTLTSVPGVFVAGCASGPKDIEESAMDGAVAAARVAAFMERLR